MAHLDARVRRLMQQSVEPSQVVFHYPQSRDLQVHGATPPSAPAAVPDVANSSSEVPRDPHDRDVSTDIRAQRGHVLMHTVIAVGQEAPVCAASGQVPPVSALP